MHHIQHHILTVLSVNKWAKFTQMRPPKVDSNAYSYHLKLLLRQRLLEKHPEKGYRLSPAGLAQVDRMSNSELNLRIQPKIITMILIYNEHNEVLLLAKSKQPFIGAWTFASGKLHIEDMSARAAAMREIHERVGVTSNDTLAHVADAYIHASINGQLVSTVLSHIFTMRIEARQVVRTDVLWADATAMKTIQLAPGIAEVDTLVTNGQKEFTFAEYSINW
jgi:ADP-ribose pyrophosphatase YjhB (NUDIX family)